MDDIETILKESKEEFVKVIPFEPSIDKIISLDFTSANSTLTDDILSDTGLFINYINDKLSIAQARYGIGGYGELRTVYSRSKVFDAEIPGEEPRRLHIGVDIWGKPNTPVIAPLDGIVHSYAFNNRAGDYGVTIILTHYFKGITFYTLYGHLSLNSIKNIHEGQRIRQGDIFADLGLPHENGHWPPHLHFQLIKDLQGWKGDYPGVCRYSEKERFLQNCPDPDIILQMNQYVV